MVSNVVSASGRKWLLRGRIAWLLGGVSLHGIRFLSEQSGYALNFPGSAKIWHMCDIFPITMGKRRGRRHPGVPWACPHAAQPAAARGRPPMLLELGDDLVGN